MIRTSLAAAVAVFALLGACSDDDPEPDIADPTPTPTEASESATVSPSPTETATPALGPEETVRAWVDAWNAALASGDAAGLSELETADCRNCSSLAAVIDDVVSAGGSFTGGAWAIVSSKVVPLSKHRVKVNVAMSVAAGSTINSAGEDPVQFDEDKRIVAYELDETVAGWRISVIELLS